MAMGIDQASSELAYTYVTTMLPGVLLNSYADSIDLFLIGMNFTFGIVVIQLLVIPVHIGFCYLFVEKYNMGVKGAAQAHNITACCTMLFLFTYATLLKPIKKAWYCPRMKTFQNLKEFLMLALPGVLMLLLENTNM